jgi:Holliday junction resolvase RusA-like endonuclease
MIQFTVFGCPVGKGRPKFSTFNGHATAYTPAKTVNYENLVRLSVQQQQKGLKPFDKDVPLQADIIAYFPIPKSTSKKKRQMMLEGKIRHTKKCDADNLAKSILDALNGIAFYDDSQVCELSVSKLYSDNPRVIVRISEVICDG